ncbi:MAG: AraC family transcriptional regulator [Clostridia bacterium]|nr:AraC family transcriptional regulator [Clostridia bacterium]
MRSKKTIKTERAKELLLHIPEQTVEEIWDMLGFCPLSYFCRLFKSKVGMSPVEYKKSVDKRLEI